MHASVVERLRAFNRFYLPRFDLLGNRYLGSEYSAGEARVLYEIYTQDGCTAASIAREMHLDKGYLSRVIHSHERKGYLRREPSPEDSRAYALHLTEAGRARTEAFIQKANDQAAEAIRGLSQEDCQALLDAFDTVTRLLGGRP